MEKFTAGARSERRTEARRKPPRLLRNLCAFVVKNCLPQLGLIIFAQIFTFAQNPPISFKDVSAESGINVPHVSAPENRYIVESMSGGAAVFDCDGDNFLDAATVNGSSIENFKKGGDLFLTLYRQ